MNQHEIIPTLYDCISLKKKKMKSGLIALIPFRTNYIQFSAWFGNVLLPLRSNEIQFLHSSLHFYCLGTLQSSLTTFMQGKKMKHKKIKTFSEVLRSLTKQEIEASPSDHQLNTPVMGCLCSTDGTCTSHSLKHHKVGQQLNAQDAFHVALPRCVKPGKGTISLSCCFPGKIWSPPLLTTTLQIPKASKDPNS